MRLIAFDAIITERVYTRYFELDIPIVNLSVEKFQRYGKATPDNPWTFSHWTWKDMI